MFDKYNLNKFCNKGKSNKNNKDHTQKISPDLFSRKKIEKKKVFSHLYFDIDFTFYLQVSFSKKKIGRKIIIIINIVM